MGHQKSIQTIDMKSLHNQTKESHFMNFFLLLHQVNKRNKQEKTNRGEQSEDKEKHCLVKKS